MMAIPSRVKYKGFRLKSLMKQSFRHLLPSEILYHKKQGFMVPIAVWLKRELRGMVEDLLSRERIQKRGYFRHSYIRGVLDQHYSGRQNLSDLIYAFLVLELWHQQYMD
jgi:asparagine synthase (glutamine-hydrolysing)